MRDKFALQPAFILHRRAYRDTSLLIEFFTLNNGRISTIAKGAKRSKSSLRSSLQSFQPLLITCRGKRELQTLTQVELQSPFANIHGGYLAWAFYTNELLFRLLERQEPYPQLFNHYTQLLRNLAENTITEQSLRLFECDLLTELGYGLQLHHDTNHQALDANSYYLVIPQQAPQRTNAALVNKRIYRGSSLLALRARNLTQQPALADAKRLLRDALQHLLGDKPLKSRELLI